MNFSYFQFEVAKPANPCCELNILPNQSFRKQQNTFHDLEKNFPGLKDKIDGVKYICQRKKKLWSEVKNKKNILLFKQ